MIRKSDIKAVSEQQNIPFKNLLSGFVCETIITILCESKYGQELYLSNGLDFCPDNYKDLCVGNVYFEYIKEFDSRMELLYLRDLLKEIMSKAALEAMVATGSAEEGRIKLFVTIDEMYVPVVIHFARYLKSGDEPLTKELSLTMYSSRKVKYLENPKEELIVKALHEIILKLELINNMDCYYDVYNMLITCPVNGRKIRDGLYGLLQQDKVEINDTRLNMLKSYRDYTYMKKKWKVELRQKKKSEPQWSDIVDCLIRFLEPIWKSMEEGRVFLGDWMPQLKRFLD